MATNQYIPNKLEYQLKIHEGRIYIRPLNDYTNIFISKSWSSIVNKVFDSTQIQKVNLNYVVFKQHFLYKDLKGFLQILQKKLQLVRYCSSLQVHLKGLQQTKQKVFNIKITVPGKECESEKKPYKDFILGYDVIQIKNQQEEYYQDQIGFESNNPKAAFKTGRRVVIKKGKYRHFVQANQVQLRYPKTQFVLYYFKQDHSKIKQVLTNLQQNRQEWLLYPLNPILDQYSMEKIYYQELIQKILIKKSSILYKICQNFHYELVDKRLKIIKDDMINRNQLNPQHPLLEEGYYLGFHIFGQIKHYYHFYMQINNFFAKRRMWILRPQKICCCQSLADLQDYLKQKQDLQSYLISDHIVVIIKSPQDADRLTAIKYRQKQNDQNILSQQQRILQILQTGQFILDTNDFDQEDLQYIYKQKQKYKEYLLRKHRAKVQYMPQSTKYRICILCQISAYRFFKGSLYAFINDFKAEKQCLRQFNTPFHLYLFQTYFKETLQKQFPEVKFLIAKKNEVDRVWVKFHSKDRSQFMQRLNQLVKKFQLNLDYIVCKKQPIIQNWFITYRRPHTLSIQTLTCRKYLISKNTKVFVMPYQALSRPVDQMVFLIDHSFQNCWQFVQIAQQNDVNLMSLFLQFQQKKTKKPDRIKSIPLTNHRYINKMLLWYNDMLKKIQNRRQQDIKKLNKRYEDKTQMHIMIPRHATLNILLNFVLPSFIKQFTHQFSYNLKQIYFYYPILFNDQHKFVENATLKVIDQQMKKAKIQLQNQNYLSKDSIKKIAQMEYLTLKCSFQGDHRIWKASNLSSYVFFIERQILMQRKTLLSQSATAQIKQKILNFKIPIFFIDSSYNNQIIVNIGQSSFYKVGKIIVQGPFQIKSDKKYQQLGKCVSCIKTIFRSLSYVVLYVDKDYRVSKNGYYYSHKDFIAGLNVIIQSNPKQQQRNFKKIKQPAADMTFNANQASAKQSFKQSFNKPQVKNVQKNNSQKIILYPMKLQINTYSNRRANYEQSGKIIKRQSKRLIVQIVQSQLTVWYMAQTCKQKIQQLQQYLKNPNNYKDNDNLLLGDISQISILDLNQQKQKSRFLQYQQVNENRIKEEMERIYKQQNDYKNNLLLNNNILEKMFSDKNIDKNNQVSMQSIDLSMIGNGNKQNDRNNMTQKVSFFDHFGNSTMNNISTYNPDHNLQ